MNRAFLTGASRGIGHVTARMLETRGWRVVAPPRTTLDLTNNAQVAEYVTQEGGVPDAEALILNAHTWYARPLHTQVPADFDTQMAYVRNHWVLLRAFLRQGVVKSVVAVASTRGLIGGVDSGPYSMAKAALIAMIQGFAREYHSGVRFNCVAPGLSATQMEKDVRESGGCSQDAVAQPPEVVARLIVDLLEDTTANGQVWRVNAGKAERMAWGVL